MFLSNSVSRLLFKKCSCSFSLKSETNEQMCFIYPVDTGRKLNVHKTFKRRPGRLLNVLCTFNLRPVSTGMVLRRFFSVFQLAKSISIHFTLASHSGSNILLNLFYLQCTCYSWISFLRVCVCVFVKLSCNVTTKNADS